MKYLEATTNSMSTVYEGVLGLSFGAQLGSNGQQIKSVFILCTWIWQLKFSKL